MPIPLSVLLVEDSPSDAALSLRHLTKAGFELTHLRVETAAQMREALRTHSWDIVLCDFSLPGFNATSALATLQETSLDIPFIVVSGSIGDETAIELMRNGARDYLMKNNMARLAPAVERELREAALRREQRAAEKRLRLSIRVFESADEGIIVTDAQGDIVATNPAFEKITGYREVDVLGRNPRFLKSGRHDSNFFRNLWNNLLSGGHWSGEIWNRRKNGEIHPAWMTLSAVKDAAGSISNYVGMFSDRSAILEARERVDFLSHHDAMTGLPNRALLRDRLQQALDTAAAEHHKVAVLLLNVDRLQRINDSLGHDAGDAVIRELANRLATQVAPGDTLARLGSDEFVMVLTHCDNADEIMVIAQKLTKEVARPLRLNQDELLITACIGITVYPDDGMETADLLKGADTALSLVKNDGPNSVRFFTAEMNARALRRIALENRLRHAMERKELLLHFQPQISIGTGRICGMEALIRWENPELGLISPVDFIPLAEETGLILPIGEWVIQTACAQNKAWQEAGLPQVCVAVNVSAHQFVAGTLPAIIARTLNDSGLDPAYLEIELTESVMMRDPESCLRQITELRRLGVSVSLDDFGTGYSSLAYLSRFTIDKLKIDQSFIRHITTDARSAAITTASIALARSLGTTVIAEGVETQGQLDYLSKAGCDAIQGYLISHPLPPEKMALLLADAQVMQALLSSALP